MAHHYRKDKVAASLSVVLLAALLVANGYSAATKVVLVSPINKDGLLARGYSLSSTRIGSCGVSGDFGPWTLSCSVGHIRYMACWPLAMPGRAWTARAVCTDYPWQHAVISISTTDQKLVPADFKSTVPLSEAWGLELTDGLRCLQFFGSTTVVDDKAIRYFCTDNKTALLDGTFDYAKTSQWTVDSAVVNPKTLQWHLGSRVSIAEAWYFVDRSRTS